MTRKKILLATLFCSLALFGAVLILQTNVLEKVSTLLSNGEYRGTDYPGVTVAVSADMGYNINADKVLEKIRQIKPDFYLHLGDLSYNEIEPESKWCEYIRNVIGDIPFQVVAGNHESDGLDGLIDEYIKCLPNSMKNTVGEYGKQYYFDYPAENPVARFILISPELHFTNGTTTYGPKTENLAWLDSAIDGARTASVPWVIVGMHKDCIRPALITCEITPFLMNYLIRKRVDLILQAHAHVYIRTKQLTCVIAVERGIGFDDSCVTKNKLSSVYQKGEGPITMVVGTGGQPIRAIAENDAVLRYFEKIMRRDENATHGVAKLTITPEQLRSEYVSATDVVFRDTFVIKK